MDKSMDKIRYVPVPRGTNIEMSLSLSVSFEGQNEGQID